MGYASYGSPSNQTIFVFHGTPGSRLFGNILADAATAEGISLIAPERPGYGLSISHPAPLLALPDDVAILADKLGIERFSVLGVSGGGPVAMACAFKLANRVRAAGLVSSLMPLSVIDTTGDMVATNRLTFRLARLAPGLAATIVRFMTLRSLSSSAMQKHLEHGTSPTTAMSPNAFAVVMQDQIEGLRSTGAGLRDDFKRLWQPLGFRLEEIAVPIFLWHGEADEFAPVSQARYVAKCIPVVRPSSCPVKVIPIHSQTGLRRSCIHSSL